MQKEFIFIDTETTGCRPTVDRVIDIGFYHVVDNEIVAQWEQLINPETPIPGNIQSLTGITNKMVADAPVFADIASELAAQLKGKIFVAHNARFDYAFIRNEMKRVGISFQAKTLCTVKLSRKLFPHEPRHNLDAIAARYNLTITGRHRALADANLIVQFFAQLPDHIPNDTLTAVINKSLKEHVLPTGLSCETLEDLPSTAGVYRFYGDNGALLYIGKSTSLRERVLSHFSSDHTSNKEMQLSQQVKSIDYIMTAGELGALLKEATLIKQESPIFNRQLRRHKGLFTWQLLAETKQSQQQVENIQLLKLVDNKQRKSIELTIPNLGLADRNQCQRMNTSGLHLIEKDQRQQSAKINQYHQLKVVPCDELNTSNLDNIYGLYRQKKVAEEKLRQLALDYQLCPKLLGLEKGKGPCFYYQIRKCKGACVGKEAPEIYNLRLISAIAGLRFKVWPYPGKIAIKETCSVTERTDYHIVDQWCYLNTVKDIADVYEENAEKIESKKETLKEFIFDLDIYKILVKFLLGSQNATNIITLDN